MDRSNVSRVARFSLALMAAGVIGASPASAQAAAEEGFSLGIGGGFSKGPSAPYGSSIGYHLLGTLEFPSPVRAFRLRTDGLFADWGAGRLSALTGNLLFTPVSGKRVAPYVLAGAGAYASPGTGIMPGWTLGAGLRLPGELRSIILESRMHVFRTDGSNIYRPYDLEDRWRYVITPIGFAIQF